MLQPQKQVGGPLDSRGTRFDIYARDSANRTFIIEMQVANHKNLPYRLRYYQQQADYDILHVGEGYEKLAAFPTYVIFFCDFDYYGRGLIEYRFANLCLTNTEITAGDGRQMIVFNAKAAGKHAKIRLNSFLKLMNNQVDEKDPFIRQIREEMERIKRDPERRGLFMSYELNLMDARAEGRVEGIAETIKKYESDHQRAVETLMKECHLSRERAEYYLSK